MKKVFLSVLFLTTVFNFSNAQSYIGLTSENYAGVHGLLYNPASIADSRFTADINALGASGFVANDYYGLSFGDMLKNGYNPDRSAVKTPTENNSLLFNLDVLGPSFMMTLDDRNGIGFISRMRVFYGGKGINGEIAKNLGEGINSTNKFSLKQEDVYVTGTNWAEFGGSFARVLVNKGDNFIKAGATLKYLKGMSNAYARSSDLVVNYDPAAEKQVATNGAMVYGYSENLATGGSESTFADKSYGFGVDLGVVYEFRKGTSSSKEDENKYKLRLGLSATDIGMVKYGGAKEEVYNLNQQITEEQFETLDDFEDLKDFYTPVGDKKDAYKSVLPTTIHLDADYLFAPKIYANLNVNYSLNGTKINTNHTASYVSLAPRYETKWFSAYMPLSYMQYSGFNWGAGFRVGPLYLGSASLFSMLANKEAKGADAYIGVKVPLYRKNKIEDKDEDGIIDEEDQCPEKAGIRENNGCPAEDKDEDGVYDHEDKCPEEKGDKKNDGCPWGDADGDGINDNEDRCPDNPGIGDNNGCPSDKDGDGVYDIDDECPEKVGTAVGKGCPEFGEKEQKKLNSYAKTILFNTGKSSIREQSFEVLTEIVAILEEYPNAKFSIDGHTDSVGSAGMNQKLSDARANQVKKYLVENGIDEFRLSTRGFGEEKPITGNDTKEGRSQNRRVEINLVRE